MSLFLETNHLFLRAPGGQTEDVAGMKAAGFGAIFCNIKDYLPSQWQYTRDRARDAGVVCGPWSRMCSGEGGAPYERKYLDNLTACAHEWETPYIVNGEQEINGRNEIVQEIVEACGDDDWALSMEPTPYWDNDWTLIKVPVLPQCFGPSYADGYAVRKSWQDRGVRCVVPTYGTYSGWQPGLYPLDAPYGLYTADDCGGNYAAWSQTGATFPCAEEPTNGGDVATYIGPNHGIVAAMNRLRSLDPAGTLLVKDSNTGKWPPISNLDEIPVEQWKAYDKLERTLTLLREANDAGGP